MTPAPCAFPKAYAHAPPPSSPRTVHACPVHCPVPRCSCVDVAALGDAKSSLGDAKSSLGDAESSLGDAKSSLGNVKSSLGDAESSPGDGKSSLGDAESSLGDAESSLGEMLISRWVALRSAICRRRRNSTGT
jgi:hypothetical protein